MARGGPLRVFKSMATANLLKANDDNLKEIKDAAKGNLQLQVILLGAIDDYTKGGAGQGRATDLVQKRQDRAQRSADAQKAKRQRSELGGEGVAERGGLPAGVAYIDAPGPLADPDKNLPKGCRSYCGWKAGCFAELFQYCEPSLFSQADKKLDSKTLARQLFEYGFGLKAGATTGEVADKPGTIERGGCFGALRDVYISNGRPFRGLEMGAGGVDWKAGSGVDVLLVERWPASTAAEQSTPQRGSKLCVRDRITGRTSEVPRNYVGLISHELFLARPILPNYSPSAAALVPPGHDALVLADVFPRQLRTLRRRISDTLAASGGDGLPRESPPSTRTVSSPFSTSVRAASPQAADAASAPVNQVAAIAPRSLAFGEEAAPEEPPSEQPEPAVPSPRLAAADAAADAEAAAARASDGGAGAVAAALATPAMLRQPEVPVGDEEPAADAVAEEADHETYMD